MGVMEGCVRGGGRGGVVPGRAGGRREGKASEWSADDARFGVARPASRRHSAVPRSLAVRLRPRGMGGRGVS